MNNLNRFIWTNVQIKISSNYLHVWCTVIYLLKVSKKKYQINKVDGFKVNSKSSKTEAVAQYLQSAVLLRDSETGVNFTKFIRKPFTQTTFGQLLLNWHCLRVSVATYKTYSAQYSFADLKICLPAYWVQNQSFLMDHLESNPQRVLWKYAVNLHENTHAKLRFQ